MLIIRMILIAFELSFWRHPSTAEDPLVNKWCNAKFLKICSDEETNILDLLKLQAIHDIQ